MSVLSRSSMAWKQTSSTDARGISGRIAARRTKVLTSSLSRYGIWSHVACAFLHILWVKWKKHPLVLMSGKTSLMELWTAVSKSAIGLVGKNTKPKSAILFLMKVKVLSSGKGYDASCWLIVSSKNRKLSPVAVCVHFPSNAMSVTPLLRGYLWGKEKMAF